MEETMWKDNQWILTVPIPTIEPVEWSFIDALHSKRRYDLIN